MADDRPIIVGTDGSIRARYAVLEAARIARMYSRPLRIVTAHSPLFAMTAFDPEPTSDEIERLETILRDSRDAIRDRFGDIDIETEWSVGDAATVLVRASRYASAVVVGARGQGAVHRMLVGSVATKVATYADSPVYVVRAGEYNPDGPVTVGLAPEGPARRTLDLAMGAARAEGTSLRALRAHQHSAAGLCNMPEGDHKESLRRDIAASVRDSEALFTEVCANHPDVHATFVHIQAHATDCLIDASRISRLVVVAPNGRGPEEKTLGSVALAVLHHAPAVLVAR
ncbi:universal stress protein [Flaviflexus equikiangi]|uniref:universal stress protein n=1 Tax=Flaviflexus equikiangi TaxID=2758573 RepID=UPI0015F35DF2|nr:universal stress protein [Flaviflexus equikiangi]